MFNITIEQEVLAKALEFLEPTVGKNASQLGDNCISMKETGNGSMIMYTTNTVEFTEIKVIVNMGGTTQDIAPYVDFKRFKGIINSIPANEMISITANVNNIEIHYGLNKTPITLVGNSNGMLPLPTNSFPSSSMINVPKNELIAVLNNVSSIITDNPSNPIYNCIRIATNGAKIDFTAADVVAKRTFVSSILSTQNNPVSEVLIEASKFKKSIKIFEDYQDLDMYMDSKVVRIDGGVLNTNTPKTKGMIGDIKYYTRRLTGVFPTTIKNNFNPLPSEFCEINKTELLSCFSRVKSIEDSNSGGLIGFEVNGGDCIITMNSSYGNIEDLIFMENTFSKSFKTIFKYQNISDILKVIPTDTFEIGALPNHPTNYVIKPKGVTDMMFTVPIMVGGNNNP